MYKQAVKSGIIKMSTETILPKGEYRVGIDFNPSGNSEVNAVKRMAADFINRVEGIASDSENPEVKRLCSIAQTEMESAAMWAVKAATKK